ncbi:MAG: Gfo/Idh/MocA family oxidoreductase [Ruminococcaceae bacterium]|nr:Gfo/Idh/MocA family oxidoreductase [Oscillospiraceae bacterium]
MNIGIIGLGARSQAYVKNIPKFFSQHKIIAVCEKDKERLENYTEHYFKYGMPDKYTDFNEMLKDERLDAVVITTPDYAHLEVVSAAMDRNLNIILEKPIEASAERALAIYEKAKNYNKVLKLGFVLRYTPVVKKLKELIGSEDVGDVISITASESLEPGHSSSYMRRWHRYKKYSGGMMNTKCCHDIDVIRYLVGGDIKKVSAIGRLGIYTPKKGVAEHCCDCPEKDTCLYSFNYTGYRSKTRFDCMEDICVFNSEKDVIDSESMLVEFENGVNLAYELAMGSAYETRKGTIKCTKATLDYNVAERTIRIEKRGGGEIINITQPAPKAGHGGGDLGLLERFFECCEKGIPENDARDGLIATLVCMAGEDSIAKKKTILLEDYGI